MENSSYSKTRSPARLLAAFLAVVMLFIVMPVLPASALSAVKTVYFMNQPSSESLDSSDAAVLFGDKSLECLVCLASEPDISWNGTQRPDWQVTVDESVSSDNELKTYKLTNKNSANLFTVAQALEFGGLILKPDYEVVWKDSLEGPWNVLTPKTLDGENATYSIPASSRNAENIYISTQKKTTHQVTFEVSGGVGVKQGDEEGFRYDTRTVLVKESGTGYEFTVQVPNVSQEPSVVVNNTTQQSFEKEGTDAEKREYKYKITKFDGDLKISIGVNTRQLKLTVKRPETNRNFRTSLEDMFGDKNEFEYELNYGGSYSFTIQPTSGYTLPTVTANDKAVEPVGNQYTINNIQKDTVISIGENAKESYEVQYHFPKGVLVKIGGQDISGQSGTLQSGSYSIEITLQPEYSDSTIRATINAILISLRQKDGNANVYEGTFNVSGASSLEISGVSINTYNVMVAASQKYNVQGSSSSPVTYGDNVAFTLTLTEGYEMKDNCGVSLGGKTLTKDSQYELDVDDRIVTVTIKNVTESGTITFADDGISLKKLTVGFDENNEKFSIEHPDLSENKVEYNSDVTFSVTPGNGYRIKSVYWTKTADGVNDARNTLELVAGKYSLTGVTADRYVHVEAEPINYTLKLHATQTTTTFDEELGAKQDGDVFTITFNADNGNETLKKIFAPQENGCEINFDALNEKITHVGWKIEYWMNTQNSQVRGKWTMQNSSDRSDVTVELNPKWTVNTETGAEDNGFFQVLMETFKFNEGGKTTLTAKILTNLKSADDKDGVGAVMVAHGFLYANSKENMDSATGNTEELMQKLKDASAPGDKGNVGWLEGFDRKVLYFKRITGDNSKAMFEEGHYSVTLTGTDAGNYVAVAWAIVRINGEEFLFVSAQKMLDQ